MINARHLQALFGMAIMLATIGLTVNVADAQPAPSKRLAFEVIGDIVNANNDNDRKTINLVALARIGCDDNTGLITINQESLRAKIAINGDVEKTREVTFTYVAGGIFHYASETRSYDIEINGELFHNLLCIHAVKGASDAFGSFEYDNTIEVNGQAYILDTETVILKLRFV